MCPLIPFDELPCQQAHDGPQQTYAGNQIQPTPYQRNRMALIVYLKLKVEEADWHGVSDAANDLRVMEATR